MWKILTNQGFHLFKPKATAKPYKPFDWPAFYGGIKKLSHAKNTSKGSGSVYSGAPGQ